ncbi:GM11810 [Drosophila sechellia]|uniref:GM11810 n=1 Tax=Drosophila sechellia TaxID=7238 RepID=B4IH56_DROSE|nr:GM11810 [Drosophila sechellia]
MDNLGVVLLVLCAFSFLLFLLRVLLIACRSYSMSLRPKQEQAPSLTHARMSYQFGGQ